MEEYGEWSNPDDPCPDPDCMLSMYCDHCPERGSLPFMFNMADKFCIQSANYQRSANYGRVSKGICCYINDSKSSVYTGFQLVSEL